MMQEGFTVSMGKEALSLDKDLILFASAHNEKDGGYSSAFPPIHDHNVYLKMRLTTGSKTSPVWKNGKVGMKN